MLLPWAMTRFTPNFLHVRRERKGVGLLAGQDTGYMAGYALQIKLFVSVNKSLVSLGMPGAFPCFLLVGMTADASLCTDKISRRRCLC